ncbi:MAG: hypothetical protein KOO62_11865 [candidate division Zixibacteria bacterium]|nr:hypothetical protein [candidate division Zixibacteria bacterium]
MIRSNTICVFAITVGLLMVAGNAAAVQSTTSAFALEGHKIRYDVALALNTDEPLVVDPSSDQIPRPNNFRSKSPAKAFLLSLAVPGMGQLYNGSRFKAVGFLGAEVTSWIFYSKWHGQADDMTAEFEQFNRDHWNQEDYETYLLWAYGKDDDDSLTARELSHHLPDTRTQQYYEMTGKYDQFAWGWDDANLEGQYLYDYSEIAPPPHVNTDENIPSTSHRLEYEQMRKDTDGRYKRARRMIFVSIANRLVSAFEGLISAKKHNSRIETQSGSTLARVKIKASLKSYHARRDTPFVTFTYKF